MIEIGKGSILVAKVEALVNPVNCVGVMGKGLALSVKLRWPEAYAEYRSLCNGPGLQPGDVHVVSQTSPMILNLATKQHWRNPSKLEWIGAGLGNLKHLVCERGIRSLAIPAIGCGNGGLPWLQVRALIGSTFCVMPYDLRLLIFEPQE